MAEVEGRAHRGGRGPGSRPASIWRNGDRGDDARDGAATGRGGRCGRRELPVPRGRARPGAAEGEGVRRLPHRPAPARRRGRRAAPAARARPPDRRRGRGAGDPRRAARRRGGARRRPLAGLDRRRPASTAAAGARTSARTPASPAATSTAATPSTRSPTRATASRCPPASPDEQAAPLLCAGLIGYRALRMCGEASRLGLYGFGAAAHILAQVARLAGAAGVRLHPRGRRAQRRHSPSSWARSGPAPPSERPPEPLDAAIIFAPVGGLVPLALRGARPRRHRRLRRHPHERHPLLPLRAPVGGAGPAARSPTSPARTPLEMLELAPAGADPHAR